MTATARNEAKLAVHGGNPVRDTLLPYGRQSIDEEDIQAVVDVLRSEWVTTGPKVGEFEEAFAAKVGARFAAAGEGGEDRSPFKKRSTDRVEMLSIIPRRTDSRATSPGVQWLNGRCAASGSSQGDNFEDLLWADVGRTTAPGCVGQDLADPTLYRRVRLLAFHDTQLVLRRRPPSTPLAHHRSCNYQFSDNLFAGMTCRRQQHDLCSHRQSLRGRRAPYQLAKQFFLSCRDMDSWSLTSGHRNSPKRTRGEDCKGDALTYPWKRISARMH